MMTIRLSRLLAIGMILLFSTAAVAQDAHNDAALRSAVQEVGYYNFDRAYKYFTQVMETAPAGSAQWEQATFGAAVSAHHVSPATSERINEAKSLYLRLVETSPKSEFARRAWLNLGRILELRDFFGDAVDLAGAREHYQKAIDGWPDDEVTAEATMRVAGTYIQTYEQPAMQQGIDILRAWLDAHPDEKPGSSFAAGMWHYVGDTYFHPMRDYAKAVEAYDHADRLGWLDRANQWQIFWRIARLCHHELKNHPMAIKYYTKIIREAPTGGKFYEAVLALQELGAPVPQDTLFDTTKMAAPATAPSMPSASMTGAAQ